MLLLTITVLVAFLGHGKGIHAQGVRVHVGAPARVGRATWALLAELLPSSSLARYGGTSDCSFPRTYAPKPVVPRQIVRHTFFVLRSATTQSHYTFDTNATVTTASSVTRRKGRQSQKLELWMYRLAQPCHLTRNHNRAASAVFPQRKISARYVFMFSSARSTSP